MLVRPVQSNHLQGGGGAHGTGHDGVVLVLLLLNKVDQELGLVAVVGNLADWKKNCKRKWALDNSDRF